MKILELNKVISDYKSQVIAKTNELEKWQRDRMNYAKEIEDYSIFMLTFYLLLFWIDKKLKEARGQNAANEDIIKNYKELISDYKRKLQRQEIDNGRQIAQLKKDIGMGENNVLKKENEIEKLKRDLTLIQSDIADSRKAQERLINQLKSNQAKEIQIREEQIARLRGEVERLVISSNNPEELMKYQKENERLQDLNSKLNVTLLEKEENIQEVNNQKEELLKEINNLSIYIIIYLLF